MDLSMSVKNLIITEEIKHWEGVYYQATIRVKVGRDAGLGEGYLNEQMQVAEKAMKMVVGLKKIADELKGSDNAD